MNRRGFLLLGMSSIASESVFARKVTSGANTANTPGRYVFSANDQEGAHYLSCYDTLLNTKVSHAIPFRAHDVLCLSNEMIIGFGRRPGFHCAQINFKTGYVKMMDATAGRHFYGHGCLSADKFLLFTTESDFDNARGVIGIRDANTLKPLGEFSSFGVGPHDIHLMPDKKTLVVANGGIQTHPDYGRRKLNIKTMQPSLVYIDVETGQKLGEYRLNDHLLSIRHLTVTATGDVGVAMQYQGDLYRQNPHSLVAWQRKDGSLVSFRATDDVLGPCRGYMADLAYDPELELLAVTSPRGNRITVWDINHQAYCYSIDVAEVSGIQFLNHQKLFLVSDAKGNLMTLRVQHECAEVISVTHHEKMQWDNHFTLS